MAHCFIIDFVGGELAAYDRVIERMQLEGQTPPNCLYHACGMRPDGLRVVDVWRTQDAFQRFTAEQIVPHSRAEGFGEPFITYFACHQLRLGPDAGAAPALLQMVRLKGVDAATFEAMNAQVVPGGGLPDGVIWHVNGQLGEDYCVVDTWSSAAKRDAFMEAAVQPVMAMAGMSEPPAVEDVAVHNALATREAVPVS